ncbi:leucine-rich repeat-containing G-protein coupled receptor 5A [Amyelois transitella]|uniref:leucine-rich repeat-containing G-protein coupled receptor 5A n=1 Tax=Amyelois transitella TaxID=680683 RepID=UPI00298FF63C|nr:leucine-rich repeat-containing G-protein coupled receptor 5A [Amyelois transitella]
MAGTSRLLLLAVVFTSVHAYCPQDKIYSIGDRSDECRFRIYCIGNIRGISLPEKCRASTNYPVNVEVILTDAIERFDERIIDADFLISVTSLKASGKWPQTKLSFLHYMPQLQNLSLVGNNIGVLDSKPFYILNRLENLDLSRNRLSNLTDLFRFEPEEIEQLDKTNDIITKNKLTKLNLAFNLIKDIPGDVFEELISLVDLDLSFNHISKLDEQVLAHLTNLQILKLNNNKIVDLNGALNKLLNLKHLYVGHNKIQNISDESLDIIHHLETLDFSTNEVQILTSGLFSRHWEHLGGHSICKIILSGNNIFAVPNATTEEYSPRSTRSYSKNNIDVLTELDLSKNSITDIGYDAFSSLVRLRSLDLSCNKLIDFVVNANDLEYVRYLNLSTNYITHLYFDSFASMRNLYNLDLSHNRLEYIPDFTFINNFNLKHVNMTDNEFTILKNIHIKIFHPDGGILDLSNNGISRLTIPLGEGLRMRKLFLSSNNISEAMFINLLHQTELVHVDMSKNYIELLNSSSLCLPVTVSNLDLSFNHIRKIEPAAFHRIRHLEMLRLSHNELTTIDYGSFQGLIALRDLDLSFNKIAYLDSKVLSDLKSLQYLSIRSNKMYHMDYKGWIGHKNHLEVYVDGNNFTCNWLSTALSDYHNHFSQMRPTVLVEAVTQHSVEGIPCLQTEVGELISNPLMSNDDRMLSVNLQILGAIKEQTYFIKKYMAHAISERAAKY